MSSRPLSLRIKLLGWLLVPLVAVNILAIAESLRSARREADAILDRVLAGSVLAIAERVIISETGDLEVDIPYVALEMLTSSSQDRVFYRIDRGDGEFVTGYRALEAPVGETLRPGDMRFGETDWQGAALRFAVLEGAVSTGSQSVGFRVTVAETTTARQKLANSLLRSSLIRQALLLALAPLVVWLAVTRALGPLYALRDAIARRSPGDLRPISHEVPPEMQGMLDATNGFIQRLRAALDAMRNFAGNASHQLRTPLAIVRTNLALAQRAEDMAEARRLAAEADQAVAQAERTLAQLLVLARVDATASDGPKGVATDLAALSRDVAAEAAPEAASRGVDLGYEGAATASGEADPVLLREALRNLVHNATRHARTAVTVRVMLDGRHPVLEVEDDGPGLPEPVRLRAGQRFNRPENAASQGSGLGLAIAREIAILHGGELELATAPQGGLLARMTLGGGTGSG